MAKLILQNQTEPASPDAGCTTLFVDSSDGLTKVKDGNGNVCALCNGKYATDDRKLFYGNGVDCCVFETNCFIPACTYEVDKFIVCEGVCLMFCGAGVPVIRTNDFCNMGIIDMYTPYKCSSDAAVCFLPNLNFVFSRSGITTKCGGKSGCYYCYGGGGYGGGYSSTGTGTGGAGGARYSVGTGGQPGPMAGGGGGGGGGQNEAGTNGTDGNQETGVGGNGGNGGGFNSGGGGGRGYCQGGNGGCGYGYCYVYGGDGGQSFLGKGGKGGNGHIGGCGGDSIYGDGGDGGDGASYCWNGGGRGGNGRNGGNAGHSSNSYGCCRRSADGGDAVGGNYPLGIFARNYYNNCIISCGGNGGCYDYLGQLGCGTSGGYVYGYTDNLINCGNVNISKGCGRNTTYNGEYCVYTSLTNINCYNNDIVVCQVSSGWVADRNGLLQTYGSYDSCGSTTTIIDGSCCYQIATNSSTGANRGYGVIRKGAKVTTTGTVTLTFYSF